jgi:hypothetical protein
MADRITETIEEWHVHAECHGDEVPHVAAAIPKIVAGITGGYHGDVVHVHQVLPAAASHQALPPSQPAYSENGSTHLRKVRHG